jgi:ubiquitin carboxyl-terminal hydrolase 9/13
VLFDDELVEPVDRAYVRNFFGGENVLACAYVLFYQETTLEAMQREMEEEGLADVEATETLQQDGLTTKPLNQNGTTNGSPLQYATTPGADTDEKFANLALAASAPPVVGDHSHPPPLDQTITNLPVLSPKKSNLAAKKEKAQRAKEEKERKAAEKELEKQVKQKRKELEAKQKETIKKQEEDLRMALAASKLTKQEEDKREKGEHNTVEQQGKENGSKSGLSRFKHSSMSLRHKPKFWPSGHKDKHEGEGSNKDAEHLENVPLPPTPGGLAGASTMNEKPEKEKMKNRFSLGRKKSTFHL